MSKEAPAITLQFDRQNYEPINIYALKKRLENVERIQIQEMVRKSIESYAIIVLIIAPAVYYFEKGFFSKLGEKIGEKLGEAIGNDTTKVYEKFKTEAIKVIKVPKNKAQIPTVEFRLPIDDTILSGFVKSSDEAVIAQAFDGVKELFNIANDYIIREKLSSKIFVFNFDVKKLSWVPSYYINKNNDLYKFDE